MKCPHCQQTFTPPAPKPDLWALRYMFGKGWLFKMISTDDKWKTDRELVEWLGKGWIERQAGLGFRITQEGERALKNAGS
jgi:hypothetical protein